MNARVHRRLNEALRCHDDDWVTYLSSVLLLSHRSALCDEERVLCAELALGMPLMLSAEFYENSTEIDDS